MAATTGRRGGQISESYLKVHFLCVGHHVQRLAVVLLVRRPKAVRNALQFVGVAHSDFREAERALVEREIPMLIAESDAGYGRSIPVPVPLAGISCATTISMG